MRPFNLTFGASLPIFSLVSGLVTMEDCYGSKCHAIAEYCDQFAQSCISCTTICDQTTHNFNAKDCTNHCAEYNKYDILKAEIGTIRRQYTVILILLITLLVLIGIRYSYMCIRWLRNKRCLSALLQGLHPDKYANQNGKELNATTIQNVMTIGDIERAPSQINSVIGAEGSVITTPISSRYPAENSTTPTTEYSYVNQGMVVTPVAEKTPGF